MPMDRAQDTYTQSRKLSPKDAREALNAKLASAYRELDGEIHDLTRMVWLASETIETTLLRNEMKNVETSGPWRVFNLTDEQVSGMLFCLSLLGRFSGDLERAYRSHLEGEAPLATQPKAEVQG